MKLNVNLSLYGFEDYDVIGLPASIIDGDSYSYFYAENAYSGYFMIGDDLPIVKEGGTWYDYKLKHPISDNKELLKEAKKIFIHPQCKLSRTLVSGKYGKSLDPWLADAVVVPKPQPTHAYIWDDVIMFINEEKKLIVPIKIIESPDRKKLDSLNLEEGKSLANVLSFDPENIRGLGNYYSQEDLLNAEFFYRGKLLLIRDDDEAMYEIITNCLPLNKIVFEETLQESLADETNKPTCENLLSIADMLESSDPDTVSAGLKTLSMLDYMHYPNSVKLILEKTLWRFRYNKAVNSVSVKYMLSQMFVSGRRSRWYINFNKDISKEDFKLFLELKQSIERCSREQLAESVKYFPFIRYTSEGKLAPNLKEIA